MAVMLVLKAQVSASEVEDVCRRIREMGLTPHVSRDETRVIIGAMGEASRDLQQQLEQLPGVETAMPLLRPYKLGSRDFHPSDTVIEVGGVRIGGPNFTVIAGPCAVESDHLLFEVARRVKEAGASILRGGAFKPRTSPYSFQGLGEAGLKMLRAAGEELGMPVITEVVNARDVDLVARYSDILQIGARNMQNYPLLTEAGQTGLPVFLKRGFAATIEEWLMCAEYVMNTGNHRVILCERGIRTFETSTRFTLDIGAVPVVQRDSHLPVFVDPSHAAGKRDFVAQLARAAAAAGAHGVMIEVHLAPDKALCDGPQALLPVEFSRLMNELRQISRACGKLMN